MTEVFESVKKSVVVVAMEGVFQAALTTEVHLGHTASSAGRVNVQQRGHFSNCAGFTRIAKSSSSIPGIGVVET